MKPTPTPKNWLDRTLAFGDNPDYPAPLEERIASMSDTQIKLRLHLSLGGIHPNSPPWVSVLAFDPGGTTGWSLMYVDIAKLFDRKVRPHETVFQWWHGEIDCGSQSGSAASAAQAHGTDLGQAETGEAAGIAMCERLVAIAGIPRTVVVMEDFILRTQSQSRDALSPVRIIAGLNQLLWETKSAPIYKQQPSEAKTTCTDDRLKQWGFWDSGSRHARDADRHALLFIRKVREQRSKVYAAWPILGEAVRRDLIQL